MSSFMVHSTLVDAATKEPIGPIYCNDRELMPLVGDRTVYLHCAHIKSDAEGDAPKNLGIFTFLDLSVRNQGLYRLRKELFEIFRGECVYRATVYSLPFRTFTPTTFPGIRRDGSFDLRQYGIQTRVKRRILFPSSGTKLGERQVAVMIPRDQGSSRRISDSTYASLESPISELVEELANPNWNQIQSDIYYWKSLVKKEPLNPDPWDKLLSAYKREFDELLTSEISSTNEGPTGLSFVC